MLAESSRTTTALCERPVTAGRSDRTSTKGRANASGSAMASPGAHDQQQDVAQPAVGRDLALGPQQELHRGEADRFCAPAADAVDEAGEGGGQQAQEQGWGEKVHRYLRPPAGGRRERRAAPRPAAGRSSRTGTPPGTRRRSAASGPAAPPTRAGTRRPDRADRPAGGALVVGLHRLEGGDLFVGEIDLVGVQDLEDHHVVAARADLAQAIGQVRRRVEQIGEDDDQAPRVGHLGHVGQRPPRLGAARRRPPPPARSARSRMCPPRVRGGR